MPEKRARKPLSRERVLRAALVLADKSGVDALSMRKLARKLGVEAMSLYKHVAGKEDVLDGLVDLVVGEIDVPPPGTPWRQAMRTRALSARDALRRHPWAILLIQSVKPTPVRLGHNDAVLGLLLAEGFSLELAYRAFLLLDSYIYGFTMQELNWKSEDPEAVAAMRSQALPAAYPHFGKVLLHVTQLVIDAGATAAYDVEFSFGLDSILDSLLRLRGA